MTKTIAQIHAQIARLQQEAEALRQKEVAEVVARVREAITHYGLTPDDLFGRAKPGRKAYKKSSSPTKAVKTKANSAKGKPVPVKYRDGAGNTWTGRGNKPRWLAAAIAGGKKLEDFLV